MPNFDNWRNGARDQASFDPAAIIARNPTELTLGRGATTLDAQTVAIVPQSTGRAGELFGRDGTITAEQLVVIVGTTDLDIERGDRFKWQGITYVVEAVSKVIPGQIQAQARGLQK